MAVTDASKRTKPGDRRGLATAPDRSLQQRMDALAHANEIRSGRARLKRDLRAGRQQMVELFQDPPSYLATMKVFDLLIAAPKWGSVKVHKVLYRLKISPSKTLGGLSERQRREIVNLLRRW